MPSQQRSSLTVLFRFVVLVVLMIVPQWVPQALASTQVNRTKETAMKGVPKLQPMRSDRVNQTRKGVQGYICGVAIEWTNPGLLKAAGVSASGDSGRYEDRWEWFLVLFDEAPLAPCSGPYMSEGTVQDSRQNFSQVLQTAASGLSGHTALFYGTTTPHFNRQSGGSTKVDVDVVQSVLLWVQFPESTGGTPFRGSGMYPTKEIWRTPDFIGFTPGSLMSTSVEAKTQGDNAGAEAALRRITGTFPSSVEAAVAQGMLDEMQHSSEVAALDSAITRATGFIDSKQLEAARRVLKGALEQTSSYGEEKTRATGLLAEVTAMIAVDDEQKTVARRRELLNKANQQQQAGDLRGALASVKAGEAIGADQESAALKRSLQKGIAEQEAQARQNAEAERTRREQAVSQRFSEILDKLPLLLEGNDLDMVRQLIAEGFNLRPNDPQIQAYSVLLQKKESEIRRAESFESAMTFVRAGQTLENEDLQVEAARNFARALEIAPDLKVARDALESITKDQQFFGTVSYSEAVKILRPRYDISAVIREGDLNQTAGEWIALDAVLVFQVISPGKALFQLGQGPGSLMIKTQAANDKIFQLGLRQGFPYRLLGKSLGPTQYQTRLGGSNQALSVIALIIEPIRQ